MAIFTIAAVSGYFVAAAMMDQWGAKPFKSWGSR